MRTLVLGLGNPLLTDDSVGLRVARELHDRLAGIPDVDIDYEFNRGLRLMEHMIGYDRAIIVDAMCSGRAPGTVVCSRCGEVPMRRSVSIHDTNLATALNLGRCAGMPLPDEEHITFVGIEAADVATLGESCTPAVEAAIPEAVQSVLTVLDEPLGAE